MITEEILRFAETGIENANGCYVTTDIEAIEPCIENAKSQYVATDIEAIETGIENANSCYVTPDIEGLLSLILRMLTVSVSQ